VPFWTWSHKAVARAAGLVDLWGAAKKVNSSPIAYADASPDGYEVGVGAMGVKPTPGVEALRIHALALCALPQMERDACPVVVISGRADRYAAFYQTLQSELTRRGTVVVTTRFFGFAPGATAQALAAPLLEPQIQPVIQDVVNRWVLATGAPVVPDITS
jgi:hypothetical protein